MPITSVMHVSSISTIPSLGLVAHARSNPGSPYYRASTSHLAARGGYSKKFQPLFHAGFGMVASIHGHLPQALPYKRWRIASICGEATLPCRSRPFLGGMEKLTCLSIIANRMHLSNHDRQIKETTGDCRVHSTSNDKRSCFAVA